MITNRGNNLIYVDIINDRAIKFLVGSTTLIDSYVKKHKLNKLVFYETSSDIVAAIEREKEIRNLSRDKKRKLVETTNPGWLNLINQLTTQ
jgi:putative endonuclease